MIGKRTRVTATYDVEITETLNEEMKQDLETLKKRLADIPIELDEDKCVNGPIQEDFKCIVCFGIVWDPLQCFDCKTLFCAECIKNWNRGCPCCKSNCGLEAGNRIVRKILSKLKFKCTRCESDVDYELSKDHLKECFDFDCQK